MDHPNEETLYINCISGNLEIVKILILQGVDVNYQSHARDFPLSIASYHGHNEIVELLISAGANVNSSDKITGRTSIARAVENKKKKVILTLIQSGANLNIENYNPLCIACENGDLDIAELLVQNGSKVDFFDFQKRTPLVCACLSGQNKICEFLLSKNANTETFYKDKTPLMIACDLGYPSIVYQLKETGVDIHKKNSSGWNALFFASNSGNRQAMALLILEGISIKEKDIHGKTFVSYFYDEDED